LKFIIGKKEVILEKALNVLDEFAIKICRILQNYFDYAIVGGYVAILFGRSRVTEDIDIIVSGEKLSIEYLSSFYDALLEKGFWIFNALKPENGYEYLREGLSIRIAEKNTVIPNAELKIAMKRLDFVSLEEKIKVILNENVLYLGSMELNIAYKFYLGSQKDIEDAIHLYCLFKDVLDISKLREYMKQLDVDYEAVRELLQC